MNGKNMYKPRLQKMFKILEVLSLNPEVYQYDLAKKVGCSYRTVIRQLKTLKNLKLIRLVRTEPSEKKGKEKNVWQLTLRGLLISLTSNQRVWQQIDVVANAHKDKLLIFKKWAYFTEKGLREEIIKSLKKSVESFFLIRKAWAIMFPKILTPIHETENEIRWDIDADVLGVWLMDVDTKHWKLKINYEAIWRICKIEPELKQFLEKTLHEWLEQNECEAQQIKRAIAYWNSL